MATKAAGKGKRLVASLRKNPGVRDAQALAAWIGRHHHKLKGTNRSEKGKKVAAKGKPSRNSSRSTAAPKASDAKKSIGAQVDKLHDALPMVEISEVRPMRATDNISESAHMGHKEGVIIFNPKKMDAKGLKEIEDQQKQGFLLKTNAPPLEYLATHEFGHSIGEAINSGASDPDTFEQYAPIQKAYGAALRSDAKPPSLYSKTNKKEAFAEAFADYMLNPPSKHSPLTKEVGKVVEGLKAIK